MFYRDFGIINKFFKKIIIFKDQYNLIYYLYKFDYCKIDSKFY